MQELNTVKVVLLNLPIFLDLNFPPLSVTFPHPAPPCPAQSYFDVVQGLKGEQKGIIC
jgi:hypothetical protein